MPELHESYANVKLMLSNLNLDDLKYTISADLKIIIWYLVYIIISFILSEHNGWEV